MRHFTRPRAAVLLLGAGLAVVASMAACGVSAVPNPVTPTVPTITTLPSDAEMLSEKTLGNPAANTIVEYVSFWNPTSATFYLTGDGAQMKSQLVDSGRAQILFRNLFTPSESQISGRPVAAMLARCVGNARFFDAVAKIFQTQASWVNDTTDGPDVAVERVMLGFGMGQALIDACLADTTLLNGLGQVASDAVQQTYQLPDGTQRTPSSTGYNQSILAVPAVVVNGTLFDGMNNDGTANQKFAPTPANIQPFLK